MRVERALLEELPEKKFNIGYQGEQNHTQVIISCPIMFRDYPDAVASMVVKPPQGDLYPVSLTRDGNDLTWDVSDADVAIPGEGILQLTFTDGEGEEAEIIKTVYGSYSVNASLVANGEAPDPVQSWLDEAGAALATFENEIGDIRKITTATDADEGKALSPKTVTNGKVTEWEYIDLADPDVVTQAVDDWLDDHPEATTTVQDGAITEAKLNDSLKEDLAWQTDVDGLMSAIKRPEFVVGNAEEVLSDRGESDEAVYLFRKTGGKAKAYNREQVKKIVGGTVAWNQLLKNGNFADTSSWSGASATLSISNNVCSVTATANNGGLRQDNVSIPKNHVILYMINVDYQMVFTSYKDWTVVSTIGGSVIGNLCCLLFKPSDDVNRLIMYKVGTTSGASYNVKNVECFDLTAALGSTIADYLYTLETQTAGSGVALFRSLFGKSYYAYNSGSLESVNVSEHRCVGFNQWDEEWENGYYSNGTIYSDSRFLASKNKIKVIPGSNYYFKCPANIEVFGYDVNGNYLRKIRSTIQNGTETIPSDVYFITFNSVAQNTITTYNHDICINLSNAAKNGQYEPYQQFVYSMPNVTLRGIPKLVNNEIVFDGDELYADGTKITRYGIVDLGSLTWTYISGQNFMRSGVITDAKKPASTAHKINAICSKFDLYTAINIYSDTTITGFGMDDAGQFRVRYANMSTDTDTFKSDVTGIYIVYELATPTTESADGYQELQVCNRYGTEEYIDRLATAETSPRDVAIPCGHQTFYPVNVFDYIDELTKPDNNFIADANIQSGKYFSVGNGLYLSTQAIAQGETITPGTNCTAVSLADALNAINQ